MGEEESKSDEESDDWWNGVPFEGLRRVHSAAEITVRGKD